MGLDPNQHQGLFGALWDEIDTAPRRWINTGKPSLHAWRFTPDGQRIEQTTTTPTPPDAAGQEPEKGQE